MRGLLQDLHCTGKNIQSLEMFLNMSTINIGETLGIEQETGRLQHVHGILPQDLVKACHYLSKLTELSTHPPGPTEQLHTVPGMGRHFCPLKHQHLGCGAVLVSSIGIH